MKWNNPSVADQQQYDPQDIFKMGLQHHHIANTAYPINHNWTMKPYRVKRSSFEQVVADAWQNIEEMDLYVHIPFCQARCNFCEYTVIDPTKNDDYEDIYFRLLKQEIAQYKPLLGDNKVITGFDIGGGTPALSKIDNIAQIVNTAKNTFNFAPGVVISIETTPLIAAHQPEKIVAFKQMGIERISMGVQVTQLSLAKKLGRQYKGFENLLKAVHNIRNAGFKKFNIDLMYGFAGQSVAEWRDSVEKALELNADYITLYRMRYKGTRLAADADKVDKQTVTQMATVANKCLNKAGYYAPPGKNTFSRIPSDDGCSDYLSNRVVKGTPYLGLGLGAQTYNPHILAYNRGGASKSIAPYQKMLAADRIPIQDLYNLPKVVSMAKMIAVSFYFGEINRRYFQQRYHTTLEAQYPNEVDFVIQNGLMEYRGDCLSLTYKGATVYNGVIALFYAPAVKSYLLQKPVTLTQSIPVQIQRKSRKVTKSQDCKVTI